VFDEDDRIESYLKAKATELGDSVKVQDFCGPITGRTEGPVGTTEPPLDAKPLSIGEEVTITGRVVWADSEDVLVELDGASLRIAHIKIGLPFVRRKAAP
jgi:hypothetical protein